MADEPVPAVSVALGGSEGARLDRFLADALGVSRGQVRQLLASGSVALGGRTLGYGDKGLSLPAEGSLEVAGFRRPEEQRPQPSAEVQVEVLARGPGWLAVDKSAGTPVHPLVEGEAGTVLGALIAEYPQIHGVGEGGLRSGVLHRLDVDTSGALLVATQQESWDRLREAFRSHEVEKCYRAIVSGAFPESLEGAMEFELAVARHRPARVRVVDDSWSVKSRAYPARQTVQILERLASTPATTLLEVRIETGFLHQIRVTLAHLGHPVIGDALYGEADSLASSDVLGAGRQMLHAARVRYQEIEAESPDPDDFAQLLEALRIGARTRKEENPS